ncbi:hypothetical protein FA95DRAFT_1556283 [Auriscalpium vulgare]|uniref:Uncharacterized protein n=1 Tax=Auriscalpium vulgare TaxID=40419 RepID=A0ACB8S1G4_9AGAM|nr:hypothetical protein FA95DRAFT_1556283 [Auriscalpium vulgare]
MPLFGSRHDEAPVAEPVRPVTPPHQSRSIFGRRSRSVDRADSTNSGVARSNTVRPQPYNNGNGYADSTTSGGSRGGWFNRNRSSSPDEHLRHVGSDPNVLNARNKVAEAEALERDADQALHAARMAVREARDHVKLLEREALEDARRAKMKQEEARNVSKSARGLGRHG